jgi:hypothetical protein
MSEPGNKWANVPPEELEKYVAQSPQRPGESDQDWAVRNQMAELRLLAQYPPPEKAEVGVEGTLSGSGTVTGPDENAG